MQLPDLERLKPLQQRLSFLPAQGKRPLQDNWPHQPGLTVEELLRYPGCNSVGVRTGPQHGPLAIYDMMGDQGWSWPALVAWSHGAGPHGRFTAPKRQTA